MCALPRGLSRYLQEAIDLVPDYLVALAGSGFKVRSREKLGITTPGVLPFGHDQTQATLFLNSRRLR